MDVIGYFRQGQFAGTRLVYDNGTFIVEGRGNMDAPTVLQWGDSGQMEWASPAMRDWVARMAGAGTQPAPVAVPAPGVQPAPAGTAPPKKSSKTVVIVVVIVAVVLLCCCVSSIAAWFALEGEINYNPDTGDSTRAPAVTWVLPA